ncbi:hypothetical protein [Nocardia sp. NPDC059228]|uniref:hypothetical protein n=1 Tax=Nocardia sp. NPDC059228 TaxID=3346777 RepID=UPI0036C2CCA8
MTSTETLPPIDPQITDAASTLFANVVALGSTADLNVMRDYAADVIAAATALAEALDIETQGGHGAAEDGYRPANRPGVIATIRARLARTITDGLTWRDDDGHLHLLYSK